MLWDTVFPQRDMRVLHVEVHRCWMSRVQHSSDHMQVEAEVRWDYHNIDVPHLLRLLWMDVDMHMDPPLAHDKADMDRVDHRTLEVDVDTALDDHEVAEEYMAAVVVDHNYTLVVVVSASEGVEVVADFE